MALDVYLYGMAVVSTIHRCRGELPLAGGYGEIEETHVCPGGEAMNAALLLSSLGLRVALAGPHWGTETRGVLEAYAARHEIDVSGVTRSVTFAGVRDLVLVGGDERAVLGWFGRYFSGESRHWDEPDERAIARARVVAIDPYFPGSSERAARLAREHRKPYVTIDCPLDGELHRGAAITVVSREYRKQRYPRTSDDELLRGYSALGSGLCVFTSGKEPIRFVRGYTPIQQIEPPQVQVKSTLGAGDTFRAGMVYGLRRGFDDRQCVTFAAHLAALMCTRLPIADHLPSAGDVEALAASTR